MSDALELLEARIRKVIARLQELHQENERLRSECESLRSQLAHAPGDGRKSQRIAAEYDLLRRNHEQAVYRIDRALQKLNALRNN